MNATVVESRPSQSEIVIEKEKLKMPTVPNIEDNKVDIIKGQEALTFSTKVPKERS